MPTIRTVARELRHEIPKVKGSRFIAAVARVATPEAALAVLAARRAELRDATHHCWAWRLGPGPDLWRLGDDGEPSGTAGRPILQEIDGRRLTDVLVVVTRYYGGTKLGTGGLIRAYAEAAATALDLAGTIEEPIVTPLHLRFAYPLTGPVQGVLTAFALKPTATAYAAGVAMRLQVPVEHLDALTQALRDATGGQMEIDTIGKGGAN